LKARFLRRLSLELEEGREVSAVVDDVALNNSKRRSETLIVARCWLGGWLPFATEVVRC
jgi:hypothetical protein